MTATTRTRMARGERGLVPVPEPVIKRRRRPFTPERSMQMGARALGISFEAYRDHVMAGERWCSLCKRWQPVEEFGFHKLRGLNTACVESVRTASREWQRRKRAAS